MKPRIVRVTLSSGQEIWSVEVGQYQMLTECFALACCYAGTGELKRRFPELKKVA
jgi:hypothetical protein